MEADDEMYYPGPADPERIRRMRDEIKRRWDALSDSQRKARREAIAVLKAAIRASPRRVVSSTHSDGGDIILERADGSRSVIRRAPLADGPLPGNG